MPLLTPDQPKPVFARVRNETTGRFESVECGVPVNCRVCGGESVDYARCYKDHVCLDCYFDQNPADAERP